MSLLVCALMKLRLRFTPAWSRPILPPGDRGISLLTLGVLRRDQGGGWRLELAWKRFLAAAAVMTVVLYLGVVTAIWAVLDREPHNKVTWSVAALAPVRWEEFRTKRGETAIAQGLEQLKQRKFGDAYFNLTAGLARAPENTRARATLAMLRAAGEPSQAITMLEAGLSYATVDVDLVRTLFGLYDQQLAQGRLIETATKLLERQPPVPPVVRQYVALAAASRLADRGATERAGRLLQDFALSGDGRDDALLLSVRADLLARLGRGADLPRMLASLPANTPEVDRVRAEAAIALALGDVEAFQKATRRWLGLEAGNPAPYLFAFQGWHRLKRFTFRDKTERDFYAEFGLRDQALQLLAASCVGLDLPETVQRCLDRAINARLSGFAFRVHLTEIALRRGDFDTAFRQLRNWDRTIETLSPEQRAYPEFIARLTRLAVAGVGAQDDALLSHLASMRGRASAPIYRLATDVLERAGRQEAAIAVARQGAQFYPFSEALSEVASRLTAAQVAAAPATPERPAAAPTVAMPATAEAMWTEVDAAFEREEFTRVRDMLRALRSARPAWLTGPAERDFSLRELRLAVLTQELVAARTVVRSQLETLRSAEDAGRVLQIAAALLGEGRTAEARMLRDETMARHGGNPALVAQARALALPDDLAPLTATSAAALAAIDDALARGRTDDALRSLDYVRKQAPAWLEGARNDLVVREVRARLAMRQRPQAFTALKEIVVRSGAPRSAAFKLVRDLIARGEAEAALQVAREIVRLLPDDPAAAKLLKEAEAPRPAG